MNNSDFRTEDKWLNGCVMLNDYDWTSLSWLFDTF